MMSGLQYPQGSALWLMGEVQRLSGIVCDLLDTLVQRDQENAALKAEIEKWREEKPDV